MATASGIQLRADPQRSIAFGSIGSSYSAIGTQLDQPMRIVYIVNGTDALLQFSFTGNTDHFVIPAQSYILFDVSSDQALTQGFYISKGTTVYVKRIGTPSSGTVYLSAFYGV